MRALVISDSHLGAWTGRTCSAQERPLSGSPRSSEEIDELIVLGDLFDFLFGTVGGCFEAAEGLFDLLAEKLPWQALRLPRRQPRPPPRPPRPRGPPSEADRDRQPDRGAPTR